MGSSEKGAAVAEEDRELDGGVAEGRVSGFRVGKLGGSLRGFRVGKLGAEGWYNMNVATAVSDCAAEPPPLPPSTALLA